MEHLTFQKNFSIGYGVGGWGGGTVESSLFVVEINFWFTLIHIFSCPQSNELLYMCYEIKYLPNLCSHD